MNAKPKPDQELEENTPLPCRRLLSWSLAGALIFFVFLWYLDFPKPWGDDLFYCGAGLHLAEGGDFSNPLLERKEFPSKFFFVYPPLYPYVVGGWCKLFGISAASLTGLHISLYLLIAAATIGILRRYSAPVALEWLAPLGVTATFLRFGLRPEPLAIGLTMAGLFLIECVSRRRMVVFFGFLFIFLGGSVAPRLTPFSAAFAALAGWRLWRSAADKRERRVFLAIGFGAWLVTVLMLLWMIDFKVREFWVNFHMHSAGRNGGPRFVALVGYVRAVLGVTQWPLALLFPVMLFLGRRQIKSPPVQLAFFIAGALPLVFLIRAFGFGTLWYLALIALLMATPILKSISRGQAKVLTAALLFAFLLANTHSFFLLCGQLTGEITSDRGDQAATALAMRPSPEHPLLIDISVARYVFDYRLPPGSLDFGAGAPFPKFGADQAVRPGDIYLLGPDRIRSHRFPAYLINQIPMWSPFHKNRWAFIKQPRMVYIVTAEASQMRRE